MNIFVLENNIPVIKIPSNFMEESYQTERFQRIMVHSHEMLLADIQELYNNPHLVQLCNKVLWTKGDLIQINLENWKKFWNSLDEPPLLYHQKWDQELYLVWALSSSKDTRKSYKRIIEILVKIKTSILKNIV
jgi:hypothetical protein